MNENNHQEINQEGLSDKNLTVAILLCTFLGPTGAHLFYLGHMGKGLQRIAILAFAIIFLLAAFIIGLIAFIPIIFLWFKDFWQLINFDYHDDEDLLLAPRKNPEESSPLSFRVMALLTVLGGTYGLHRIYAGKLKTGIALLVLSSASALVPSTGWGTFVSLIGLVGPIWAFIDYIRVTSFKFTDDQNLTITQNHNGEHTQEHPEALDSISQKSFSITVLLTLFLGFFGAHRFYLERTLSGLYMLITTSVFILLGITAWLDPATLQKISIISADTISTMQPSLQTAFFIACPFMYLAYIIQQIDFYQTVFHRKTDKDNKLIIPCLEEYSIKSYVLTLMLFAGGSFIGLHRFYTNHTKSAIALILTPFLGLLHPGILLIYILWLAYDGIMIITGNFKASDGLKVAYN